MSTVHQKVTKITQAEFQSEIVRLYKEMFPFVEDVKIEYKGQCLHELELYLPKENVQENLMTVYKTCQKYHKYLYTSNRNTKKRMFVFNEKKRKVILKYDALINPILKKCKYDLNFYSCDVEFVTLYKQTVTL